MWLELVKNLLCVNVNNSGNTLGDVNFLSRDNAITLAKERVKEIYSITQRTKAEEDYGTLKGNFVFSSLANGPFQIFTLPFASNRNMKIKFSQLYLNMKSHFSYANLATLCSPGKFSDPQYFSTLRLAS